MESESILAMSVEREPHIEGAASTSKRGPPELSNDKEEKEPQASLAMKKPKQSPEDPSGSDEAASVATERSGVGFTFGGWKKKPAPTLSAPRFPSVPASSGGTSHSAPQAPFDSDKQSLVLQAEGCTLAESGDFGGALRKWDVAIRLTPSRAVLHELRAQVLLEMDETFPAIQAATRAVTFAPQWPEGHLTLGRAQLNYGEVELAVESLERVLILDSGHTTARQELEYARSLLPIKQERDRKEQEEVQALLEERRLQREREREGLARRLELTAGGAGDQQPNEEDAERGVTGMSDKEWRGFVDKLRKQGEEPGSMLSKLKRSTSEAAANVKNATFVEEFESSDEEEAKNK